MAQITIEPGGQKASECERCGRVAFVAHGYAYANGDPHAIYFVDWCEAHGDQRRAYLTLAVGDWNEGSSGASRRAVCAEIHPGGIGLVDQPARERPRFFGQFLPRKTALPYMESGGLWHLADHVVLEDPQVAAVVRWVQGESESANSDGKRSVPQSDPAG